MTQQEQQFLDDKMRSGISKLFAETAQIQHNMQYSFWVLAAAYIGALTVVVKFI